MNLLVVGLNHRTAPIPLLEKAALSPSELPDVLRTMLAGQHVGEAVVLSTCNRVEVYAVVSAFHGALNDIGGWLSARAGIELGSLADHLYIHYAEDAVRHTFNVVSGLDSMVVGETQILGQLRDAYRIAADEGFAGRLLHELMQQALRVGKRVHTDTAIDQAGQSVVSAALRMAVDHTGSLAGRSALVVGAGSMGALAATTLRREGIGSLTVLNRTPERALRLASSLDANAGGLDQLSARLAEADIVVSSTGSSGAVLTFDMVDALSAARGGRPLVIVDVAVPRDTEPEVAAISGVQVVDIERLAAALENEAFAVGAADARTIIDEEIENFLGWQRSIDVAPTVAALRARAEQVVSSELGRLEARLSDLDPAMRTEVERTIRRVVSTLLHVPTVRMKELASSPGGDWYATAVRDLFLLDVAAASAAAAVAADPEVTT